MRLGAHSMDTTLVLNSADIRAVLDLGDCTRAVESVLALRARGRAPAPALLGVHVEGGGFHVKAAAADLGRPYFAAKTNGNFPDNPARRGLPTIQGVIVLCDASDGRVLALLDSSEITTLRTGAATAAAARHLARPDSSVVTIVGCGVQGRVQIRALAKVLPLGRVFAFDRDEEAARRFTEEMGAATGLQITPAERLGQATLESDVCVTCTPSRQPLLGPQQVRPGTFVAGVGADHPAKLELHPELLRRATVVVDALEQCLEIGDLHHAVEAGFMRPEDVHAELGEIAAGLKPGRSSSEEVIVFDSTGTALEDVAAAVLVYERCVALGRGEPVMLADPSPARAAPRGSA